MARAKQSSGKSSGAVNKKASQITGCSSSVHRDEGIPTETKKPSYYHRHKDQRQAYQRAWIKANRPPGSRRKKQQSKEHTHSPVFFRFGMDVEPTIVSASGVEPIYFNAWARECSKDDDRTEDMLYAETDLALSLHYLQLEYVRREGHDNWAVGYLSGLSKLAEEERQAANKLRRRSLDRGDPPPFIIRLHQHRRHLAYLRQEMDLIEQAVNDMKNGETVNDFCVYLKHAIQTGSAIITGARVNEDYFEREYGF